MEKSFEKNTFGKRLKSMLAVDFRRAFTSPYLYIILGISFLIPILILVMVTMMEGMESVNPQTNEVTVMQGFDHVWQIIGSVGGGMGATSGEAGGASAAGGMELTAMCNINLLYFGMAAFICIFISEDFRSGYAKNLFTVRARKSDYVLSKTVLGFVAAIGMLLAFFIGTLLGGVLANLPFTMDGFSLLNLVYCLLGKLFLSLVFVALYVLMSVIAKQKAWLSVLLSLGSGMLLFTMAPMITPLDSSLLMPILCLAGGTLFAVGLGAISNLVLKKSALI